MPHAGLLPALFSQFVNCAMFSVVTKTIVSMSQTVWETFGKHQLETILESWRRRIDLAGRDKLGL